MGLEDEWRLSGIAYTELVYRPLLTSGYVVRDMGSKQAVRRSVTGANLNKGIFALFTMAGALIPFFLYDTRLETKLAISFAVTVSLSLLLVFGYIVLYCVQVLPTFVSTGSFAALATLPFTRAEVSRVAAITMWRTLDYIVLASVVSQLGAIAYFTSSPEAILVVAFASVSSTLLAVGLALWLTQVFQRRIESGSLAGLRGLFRPVYFILWGLGVMSVVFIFSIVSYLSKLLVAALASPASPFGFVVSLLLPFSAGIVAAHFQGQQEGALSLALGLAGLSTAFAVAAAASKLILGVISGVVLPSREVASTLGRTTLTFSVRRPLPAYILKDLRVSSRNPATAFLFALPLFEIIAVVVPLTAASVVKMSVLLVGSEVGGGFALFVAFLLVTVEDLGVERRTALPISERVRTLSKVVISTGTYLAVPVALAVFLSGKTLTFGLGYYLPGLTIVSVLAACVVEVTVLKALASGGHGAAVRFSVGVGSGELVVLLPAVAYSIVYVASRSHYSAFSAFYIISFAELALGVIILAATRGGGRRTINSNHSQVPEG